MLVVRASSPRSLRAPRFTPPVRPRCGEVDPDLSEFPFGKGDRLLVRTRGLRRPLWVYTTGGEDEGECLLDRKGDRSDEVPRYDDEVASGRVRCGRHEYGHPIPYCLAHCCWCGRGHESDRPVSW